MALFQLVAQDTTGCTKGVRQSSASFPSACASAFFSCSARSMA
ncbi:hypothetical protein ECP03052937_4819 [Escherichia coli p0305293.7]|nr:hypothetical protein ECP03052937_4819 [Escherichia coli p0305293.7]